MQFKNFDKTIKKKHPGEIITNVYNYTIQKYPLVTPWTISFEFCLHRHVILLTKMDSYCRYSSISDDGGVGGSDNDS